MMQGAPRPPLKPVTATPAARAADVSVLKNIHRLIWLYFILLVLEGALRKWVAPQLSNPLLVIRDPVVVLIYLLAIRARVFPWNAFVISLLIISIACFAAGALVLYPYLPPSKLLFVNLFGYRSNFLHLPLIFVIAKVFDINDVKRMGWWFLVGAIPMAALTAAQFRASPEAFINRTVGLGEAQQITAGGGKIRPPGTFSFVSGVIFYFGAAAAFLLHMALSRASQRNWLIFASGLSIVVAVAVSGSRSAVASVGLVVLSLGVIFVMQPGAINKFGRNVLIVALIAWIMTYTPIFKEGVGILSDRFTESAQAAETSIAGGMIDRTFAGFVEGLKVLDRVPIGGYGLGIGTNGGAKFVTGRATFLLAEGEWSRILLESGPIFGLAFLLWRTILTFRIGYLSLRTLRRGETLPVILFSAGFVALLNGQFGQPTSLGFAALLNGLCLAAMNPDSKVAASSNRSAPSIPKPARLTPSRSPYAARLHGPPDMPTKANGAVDR